MLTKFMTVVLDYLSHSQYPSCYIMVHDVSILSILQMDIKLFNKKIGNVRTSQQQDPTIKQQKTI